VRNKPRIGPGDEPWGGTEDVNSSDLLQAPSDGHCPERGLDVRNAGGEEVSVAPDTPANELPIVEIPEDQESVTDWGSLDSPQEDDTQPQAAADEELDALLEGEPKRRATDKIAAEIADNIDPAHDFRPDPLDELDALLGESLDIKRTNDAARSAKERLKRGGMSAQEKAETEALIRQWELAHEWKAEANVALFSMQMCKCGLSHTGFMRLMTRLRHRHLAHAAMRWLPAEVSQASLPNETVFSVSKVPMCIGCADAKGWSMENPIIWKDQS
jgi:hypothetical protein